MSSRYIQCIVANTGLADACARCAAVRALQTLHDCDVCMARWHLSDVSLRGGRVRSRAKVARSRACCEGGMHAPLIFALGMRGCPGCICLVLAMAWKLSQVKCRACSLACLSSDLDPAHALKTCATPGRDAAVPACSCKCACSPKHAKTAFMTVHACAILRALTLLTPCQGSALHVKPAGPFTAATLHSPRPYT